MDLADTIGEVLKNLLERGWVLPIHVVAVGVNGGMVYSRFVRNPEGDGLDTELLTEHDEAPGLAMPLNLVFVDAEGDAARVLLKRGDANPEIQVLN